MQSTPQQRLLVTLRSRLALCAATVGCLLFVFLVLSRLYNALSTDDEDNAHEDVQSAQAVAGQLEGRPRDNDAAETVEQPRHQHRRRRRAEGADVQAGAGRMVTL